MNADYASLNIALMYAKKLGVGINVAQEQSKQQEQGQGQGKGNSTMTDMSAVTPLHASINAYSRVGSVRGSMVDIQQQGTSIVLDDGSSKGVAEGAMEAVHPCISAESKRDNYSKHGNGG